MKKTLLFLMILVIILGCEREFGSYYDPPEGMEAEIYAQLVADPELSIFVSAIDKVPGLKDELSSSGLFTVMAPNNAAFERYFANHPEYHSVEMIPVTVLEPLVKYHIMRWMYFYGQFMASNMFKYETRSSVPFEVELSSGRVRKVYHTSKMFQVYTPNYLRSAGLTTDDYRFVYGPDAYLNTETNMNIMGASVLKADISAGNGACYVIDRVMDPPLNIAEELDTNKDYAEYNKFLQKYFVNYVYDDAARQATIAQGNNGDINGDGMVDSLYTRSYSINQFLDTENPRTTIRGVTTYYSLTAYIPSKEAFSNYLNNKLLPSFHNEWDSIPKHTLAALFSAHISNELNWPSKMERNLAVSSLGDVINITRSDIKSVKMASNGLFYEVNKTIEPRLFTAVTGPAFFAPEYWYFAEMLNLTNIWTSLMSDQSKFTIFAPVNDAFKEQRIVWLDYPPNNRPPGFFKLPLIGSDPTPLSLSEMNAIVGNCIVLFNDLPANNMPNGFYRAQNTSYVVVEDGKIFASERDSVATIIDADHQMSNGYFHGINKLLFYPTYTIWNQITRSQAPDPENPYFIPVNPQYYKFKELCAEAGILNITDFDGITSANTGRKFTLFVPSNQSVIEAQEAGLLPKTGNQKPEGTPDLTDGEKMRLINYLRYFFIPAEEIFTTGNTTGTFFTQSVDAERSNPNKEAYFPIEVSFTGKTIVLKSVDEVSATVVVSDPKNRPQNLISSDGIIQVIDNAFTSRY
ncbi:MAG: fasciclin domain-containing protein [Dysgonamonadaceae bacterium]|jgi:uncharacterized surface protein with fasciclin (FAS1) repeats|nr:fasciclin domain-containing protein [Dysgonamonadaceae bacterium]